MNLIRNIYRRATRMLRPLFFSFFLWSVAANSMRCGDLPIPAVYPRPGDLCGNGVLDPGELCDDGNRISGDGCSGGCVAFDALTSAGTLAGSTIQRCPPVLGGGASTTLFCQLNAIAASFDGRSVYLGDGGRLLQMDLFSDAIATSIRQLDASISATFGSICSLGVFAPDGAIVIHDGDAAQQRIWIAMADGTHVQLAATLPGPSTCKAYYNRTARTLIAAAILSDEIGLYRVEISEFDHFYTVGTATRLAGIPLTTVFGVWERNTRHTSFDMRGFEPYLIGRDPCPAIFRPGQWCFVVYMRRVAQLQLLRAYVLEEGGLDVEYYASTLDLYDNALMLAAAPLVRYSMDGARVYTLTAGNCLQVTSAVDGRVYATLGNACRRVPDLGVACATPFNNPFLTDVVASEVLLPLRLSVAHTHDELSALFDTRCVPLANLTSSGPMLYRQTLMSVFGSTLPVDLIELPSTLDLVYVTPTTVGLISTKRIHFEDATQRGYVRATNLLSCPAGLFGNVGGICHACNNTRAPGYGTSVAFQIQCTTRAGGGGVSVSPLYETFSLVVTSKDDIARVHDGICVFTESKGIACPPAEQVTVLPPQQFNLAADFLSDNNNIIRDDSDDLIACLAQNIQDGRPSRPEYSARVVLSQPAILAAGAYLGLHPAPNFSQPILAATLINACRLQLAYGLSAFLTCATPLLVLPSASRRRLLGDAPPPPPMQYYEHQGVTHGSATSISWALDGVNASQQPILILISDSPPSNTIAANNGFPLWLGVALGIGGAVIVLLLACVLLFQNNNNNSDKKKKLPVAPIKANVGGGFRPYHFHRR